MSRLEVVVLLLLFDPVERLLLRVNTEREPGALRGEDAVLHGELVRRQALRVPPAGTYTSRQRSGLVLTASIGQHGL